MTQKTSPDIFQPIISCPSYKQLIVWHVLTLLLCCGCSFDFKSKDTVNTSPCWLPSALIFYKMFTWVESDTFPSELALSFLSMGHSIKRLVFLEMLSIQSWYLFVNLRVVPAMLMQYIVCKAYVMHVFNFVFP